jgi:hypothetical protein
MTHYDVIAIISLALACLSLGFNCGYYIGKHTGGF